MLGKFWAREVYAKPFGDPKVVISAGPEWFRQDTTVIMIIIGNNTKPTNIIDIKLSVFINILLLKL